MSGHGRGKVAALTPATCCLPFSWASVSSSLEWVEQLLFSRLHEEQPKGILDPQGFGDSILGNDSNGVLGSLGARDLVLAPPPPSRDGP